MRSRTSGYEHARGVLPMKTIVHLPLSEMPGVIRESVRAVLAAHKFTVAEYGTFPPDNSGWVGLDQREYEKLLNEIGNNVAQALMSRDANPENR